MPSFFTICSVLVILLIVLACSSDKVRGDIHPDIPELPDSRSENLELQELPYVTTLQYSLEGNIHVFGHLPDDKAPAHKRIKHLLVYSPTFELLSTQPITQKNIAFVDPQSNVYTYNRGEIICWPYPNYKEKKPLPPHPISTALQAIAAKELRNRGPRKEEHQQLLKEGKKDVIQQNHKMVAQELQDCYAQQLDLDAIDHGILASNKYVLFMKNGQVYTLINYQGMNGKASISSFFKQQKKVIIYKHYNRSDKGRSISNMRLLDQQKANNSALQKRLVHTNFSVTDKKSTWENWPNTGYTKGFHYYQLNIANSTAVFKIHASKGRHDLYILGKETAPICFLAGKSWFLIRTK